MNCCRLTRSLVNGPRRFSTVLHVGRQRTVNQTVFHYPGSVRSYYNGCRLLESFRTRLRKGLQRHGNAVWYACSHQARYVAGHRVWRGQQISIFHLKLWGGGAFTGLISCLLSRLFLRALNYMGRCIKSNKLLLSCTGTFVYDWKQNGITNDEMIKYFDEIEAALCLKRRTFEINQTTVTTHCTCDEGKANHSQFERDTDPWSIFLVLQHLLVWKREVPNHRGDGLCEYKVYGKYTDVTALDFMTVNIHTMYRKMWDNGAVVLEILETDQSSNSDVIYWEMAWPRMMNNRDYVYLRRYMIDESHKVIVIINQNTTHPEVPPFPGKERISEYWSVIVIKPITEMNKPGIEFTMTYFDNPGANVPASITAWASATAFPDFHRKLHAATKEYAYQKDEIEAFTKAEKAKNVTVKIKSKRIARDPCDPNSTGSPYLDQQRLKFEQECEEEEEKESKASNKRRTAPTIGRRTPSGCIIRKEEDLLYENLIRIL